MGLIDNITVGISVKTAELTKGLSSASSSISKFVGGITKIAAPLAAIATVGATFSKLGSSMDAIDDLGASADKIGVAAESLQTLRFAAGQSDVEIGTLDAGLKKLNLQMGQAANGAKPAQEAFAALGLDFQKLGTLTATDQFAVIAEKIKNIDNPAQQAAAAVEIFGKSGAELLPLLKVGASGITELEKKANDLGVVLTTDQISGVKEANDAVGRLSAAWDGMFNSVIAAVAPVITTVIDWFTTGFSAIKKAFGLFYDFSRSVIGGIGKSFAWLIEPVNKVIRWIWDGFKNLFGGIVDGFVWAYNKAAGVLGWDKISNPFNEMASSITADTADLTAGMDQFSTSIEDAGKSTNELSDKLTNLTADWQTQLETVGMSSRETEIHKLKALGATDAEIAKLQELDKAIQAKEDAQKAMADEETRLLNEKTRAIDDQKAAQKAMEDEGKSITESLKTDAEKAQDEISNLQKHLASGTINQETFERGLAKVQEGISGGAKAAPDLSPVASLASNARFGSAEAYSTIAASRGVNTDPMSRLQTTSEKSLKEQQKQTQIFNTIAALLQPQSEPAFL